MREDVKRKRTEEEHKASEQDKEREEEKKKIKADEEEQQIMSASIVHKRNSNATPAASAAGTLMHTIREDSRRMSEKRVMQLKLDSDDDEEDEDMLADRDEDGEEMHWKRQLSGVSEGSSTGSDKYDSMNLGTGRLSIEEDLSEEEMQEIKSYVMERRKEKEIERDRGRSVTSHIMPNIQLTDDYFVVREEGDEITDQRMQEKRQQEAREMETRLLEQKSGRSRPERVMSGDAISSEMARDYVADRQNRTSMDSALGNFSGMLSSELRVFMYCEKRSFDVLFGCTDNR